MLKLPEVFNEVRGDSSSVLKNIEENAVIDFQA
jgi:hypothetical protein